MSKRFFLLLLNALLCANVFSLQAMDDTSEENPALRVKKENPVIKEAVNYIKNSWSGSNKESAVAEQPKVDNEQKNTDQKIAEEKARADKLLEEKAELENQKLALEQKAQIDLQAANEKITQECTEKESCQKDLAETQNALQEEKAGKQDAVEYASRMRMVAESALEEARNAKVARESAEQEKVELERQKIAADQKALEEQKRADLLAQDKRAADQKIAEEKARADQLLEEKVDLESQKLASEQKAQLANDNPLARSR